MLGGGMRQAGVLAAAGQYALFHNVQRLKEDHDNARQLADKLGAIDGVDINLQQVDTNMIYMYLPADKVADLPAYLRVKNIIISPAKKGFRLGLPIRNINHHRARQHLVKVWLKNLFNIRINLKSHSIFFN